MSISLHCPDCGYHFESSEANEAQARINDLETQVRLLNSRASSYIDRLADYEDEIRQLQVQCTRLQKEKESRAVPKPADVSSENVNGSDVSEKDNKANRQSMSRLSSFTSYLPLRRKDTSELPPMPPLTIGFHQSTPNLTTPSTEYMKSPSPPPFATDPGRQGQSLTLVGLQSSLETERTLRQKAESSLLESQNELEELTAQLFGQANEMVATERKARAKLEERVKLLETRDGEKRRRLDRLEKAVERIERVRRMVVDHEKEMGEEAYTQTDVTSTRKTRVHSRRSRSRSTRRNGYNNRYDARMSRPEVVSEDEDEDTYVEDVRRSALGEYAEARFSNSRTYEFDVQLKVWRRSKANMWRTPNYD